jgi:hypothetical protein
MAQQTTLKNFLKPAKTLEEIIPKHWLTDPLPKKAAKRPVGRPRKTPYPTQRQKPAAVVADENVVDLSNIEPDLARDSETDPVEQVTPNVESIISII